MDNFKDKVFNLLNENKVVVLFIVLCIGAIYVSGDPLTFVVRELFARIGRNGFMVLSLLIPILAGMGLNFGITIGAIAAQVALFWVVYWGFTGIEGFLLTVAMATPIAMLFGWLVGKLFNTMKGAEMIAGMILGYFADGQYQLFFLFIIGGVIPVVNETLIIRGGVGVKNTIDLTGNLKYALDTVSMLSLAKIGFWVLIAILGLRLVLRLTRKLEGPLTSDLLLLIGAVAIYGLIQVPAIEGFLATDRLLLLDGVIIAAVALAAWQVWRIVSNKIIRRDEDFSIWGPLAIIAACVVGYLLTYVDYVREILVFVEIPVATYLCIVLLCVFNNMLLRTKLGQDMRTVGHSRVVANVAGIDVDRTRIIAMMLSTVLACWGQLIYLQNMGTFATYAAHTQVSLFAIAALLVGGASIQKATNTQAILGVILFHTLFIVAPQAGTQLFKNPQLGEYFRVFVAYGVIAVSLAMHAWETRPKQVVPIKVEEKPEVGVAGGTSEGE